MVCLNLEFLRNIESSDLLTYIALIIAYFTYIWSIDRGLKSWKSLLISFKKDLESQSSWLASEYTKESYKDKNSFSPTKVIYPLSFESLPEIIRRGIAELSADVSEEFISNLSLFNERIVAFNSVLDNVKSICSSDPITSDRLKDKLNNLGLDKESIEYDVFKRNVFKSKKKDIDFYLAENINRYQKVIHIDLIGNQSKSDSLHYLYTKITADLDGILKNFDKNKPFFVKYKWWFFVISIPIFIFIENIL